jgi:GTPase involved in cell partitioning and DNA repair
MEKQIIIDFLEKSGFKENGRNAYKREGTGTIFIREWNATKVMVQIMELGEKHRAKKIRDAFMIEDELFEHVVFNPQS